MVSGILDSQIASNRAIWVSRNLPSEISRRRSEPLASASERPAVPLRMPRAGIAVAHPETVKSGAPPCVGVLRCRAAQQREHDRQTNPPSARIYLDFLLTGLSSRNV